MKCIVATLFEGDYHFGAAALVNSLCRGGFTGTIFAGFRGPLPPWAASRAQSTGTGRWEMEVTPGVRLVFLKLKTSSHFTNYKPDFLLQLESPGTDAVIYIDPDIVFNGTWTYVEEWLSCGVALCEDVNSPFAENHPRRMGWRRAFEPLGYPLRYRERDFANGGFVGLRWEYRELLVTWQKFIAHIATVLGGTDIVNIEGGRTLSGSYGFADCFSQPDQDALNAALEACPDIPISFLGPQAMGFQSGRALVPHALGPSKPWRRHYIREALGGFPPNAVDRAFWQNVAGPIEVFSPGDISAKRLHVNIGAALGRFIKRR